MPVREASVEELPVVMRVLDGGLLATSVERVREAAASGDVLVAVEADRVFGALVLDSGGPPGGARVEAVAVCRRRRSQGIGTALVEAATDRYGTLVAEFDERVRPFWASLGFEVEPTDEAGRLVGTLDREVADC